MKRRIPRWLVIAAMPLFLAGFATRSPAANKAKKQLVKASANTPAQPLAWPLPPEPPRIRWLDQFSKFDDVQQKKKKKRSWVEKLAGVSQEKEQDRSLTSPYGIAVDSQGRIYVADWSSGGILVFDRTAHSVEVLGPQKGVPMRLPLGVAVDDQDRLFFSDAIFRTITCLSPEGKLLAQFGRDELERPSGLALDQKRHRLYVADTKGHRVAVFNTQTFAFEKYLGKKSTDREPGTFRFPTGVAVDRRGFLYVTDTFNYRVQIFNPRGRFEREFGSHGDSPGQFSRPKGIAVDSEGHIYVADAQFNNFQIFDQEGKVLLFVGTLGEAPGQFTLLTGLCIDDQDRIYTTEQYRPRVQIFQYIAQPESAGAKEVSQKKRKQRP